MRSKIEVPEALEKQEQVKHKCNRWKEIVKIRAETNEMKTKKPNNGSNKLVSCKLAKVAFPMKLSSISAV
jgi:hypothetical protein